LDEKSHSCILMGYFEDCKSYRQFDPIKQQIIIIINIQLNEKCYGIMLLNASFVLFQGHPFDVVSEIVFHVP
jgi:hypothetical protein